MTKTNKRKRFYEGSQEEDLKLQTRILDYLYFSNYQFLEKLKRDQYLMVRT